jgi:hypothetical protein
MALNKFLGLKETKFMEVRQRERGQQQRRTRLLVKTVIRN